MQTAKVVTIRGKPKALGSNSASLLNSVTSTAGNAAYSAYSYFSGATNPVEPVKSDYVTFTKFEDVELVEGQPPTPCLFVGFMSGFQIWDISQSVKILSRSVKKADLKVTEMMSEQGFHIKDLCVFNRLKEMTSDKPLQVERPLIGVVSDTSAQSSNSKLLLYSILSETTKKSIEFLSPILRVVCNEKVIFVISNEYAVLLDVETFEKKYYIPLYRGGLTTSGICALGPCWFAFQGPHSLGDVEFDSGQAAATPSLWSVAGNLMDMSSQIKTQVAPQISALIYGTSPHDHVSSSNHSPPKSNMFSNEQAEEKGLITIIDIENKGYVARFRDDTSDNIVWENSNIVVVGSHDDAKEKKFLMDSFKRQLNQDSTRSIHHHFRVISQFKAADDGALSAVAFNSNGTLLATSSELGKDIKVFSIEPRANIFGSHQLLYILQRGLSSATIKNINFSNDSCLISCTSSNKGTTHIFGINPHGGNVDIHSFSRKKASINDNSSARFFYSKTAVETCTPAKLGLIRPTTETAATATNENPYSTMSLRFLPLKSDSYQVMIIEPSGLLNSYSLHVEEVFSGTEQISLEITPKFEWPLPESRTPLFRSNIARENDLRKKRESSESKGELPDSKSASGKKEKLGFDQLWKESVERSPFAMNYESFHSSSDYPIETYSEGEIDITSLNDPLKIDSAYKRLQKFEMQIPKKVKSQTLEKPVVIEPVKPRRELEKDPIVSIELQKGKEIKESKISNNNNNNNNANIINNNSSVNNNNLNNSSVKVSNSEAVSAKSKKSRRQVAAAQAQSHSPSNSQQSQPQPQKKSPPEKGAADLSMSTIMGDI